jgi:hypothetical protein
VYDVTRDNRTGLFFVEDAGEAPTQIRRIAEKMMKLVESGRNLHMLHFLALGKIKGAGMMSYPNFNLKLKALNRPDALLMSILAEKSKLDLRIVVLLRDARDVINSVMKRKFMGESSPATQPRILIDNAAALYTQLELIDRNFIHCVRYKDLKHWDKATKQSFAQFVQPVIIYHNLEQMLNRVRDHSNISTVKRHEVLETKEEYGQNLFAHTNSSNDEEEVQSIEFHVSALNARLKLIESLCPNELHD